jgi:3-hydroxybutyryl-CoA dehydrogenase
MTSSAAVVGGGTMGIGIAYVFAQANFTTWIVEPSPERTRALQEELGAAARDGERRGRLTAAERESLIARTRCVSAVSDLPERLAVIIESVPERLELKRAVLRACEERRPGLLASNTSSLSINDLAAQLDDPANFLGMHFFNPVWSLPLVELVKGVATSETALARAIDLSEGIGKKVAVVNDSPGFATSRLDLIAGLEAMRMLQDGVASAEDIDRAVTLAYRHPVGPLWLSDLVGLDVRLDIARQLASALGPRFEPPQILIDKVAAGHLGKKSGQGFYTWRNR